MKTKLIMAALAGLLLAVTTGCKTTAGGGVVRTDTNGIVTIGSWVVNTNDVYNGVRIAAKIGTQEALRADPKGAPVYLGLVQQTLTAALGRDELDPMAIRKSITGLGYMPSAEAATGIEAGLALYQAFFGQVVAQKIDNASPYLRPALTALRDGIQAGLEAVVPATQ